MTSPIVPVPSQTITPITGVKDHPLTPANPTHQDGSSTVGKSAGTPLTSSSDISKEPAVKGIDTTQTPTSPSPMTESHAQSQVAHSTTHLMQDGMRGKAFEINSTKIHEIPNILNQIQGILKEGGMDSSSQIKSLARIKEILGW